MKIKTIIIVVLLSLVITGCSSKSSVKIEGVKQKDIFACKQDSDCVRAYSMEEYCDYDIAINKEYSSEWREVNRNSLDKFELVTFACKAGLGPPAKSKKAICRFNKCTLSFFSYKN
ncbi:MAG: hypothetical protein HOA57_04410 [Candidatus Magasanikbacteria bacterium]|jgi:hypothetical protein|nr:hypothetical protein [Candidatus Magasanikbacteria bacterium]MBT4314708.1 hypothetical protein [Candidatus Magasanikbacteria bacterium]MBT4547485.1 hypothetical protein [Candidatus Magasanikbacteria bacterium]MBT6819590.1 hypothetical protein [Candidatus Magasanikbacteria bacterium]